MMRGDINEIEFSTKKSGLELKLNEKIESLLSAFKQVEDKLKNLKELFERKDINVEAYKVDLKKVCTNLMEVIYENSRIIFSNLVLDLRFDQIKDLVSRMVPAKANDPVLTNLVTTIQTFKQSQIPMQPTKSAPQSFFGQTASNVATQTELLAGKSIFSQQSQPQTQIFSKGQGSSQTNSFNFK